MSLQGSNFLIRGARVTGLRRWFTSELCQPARSGPGNDIRPSGGEKEMEAGEVLTDSFGRKHNYLRISLTERCNLRCKYALANV